MRGGASGTAATARSISGSTGSSEREWKACETASRRQGTPRAVSRSASAWISVVGPAATEIDGALTAARSSVSPSSAFSSASGRRTASMAPGAIACMIRARVATRRQPSSKEKTPAMQAATSSPTLWPTMASGLRPQPIHSRASAYSKMNRAGWASRVAVPPVASGWSSSARRSAPTIGPARAMPSSSTARKAG